MRVDLGNLTEITKKSAAVQNKGTQAVLNENITTKETDKTGHSYTVKSVTYETLLAEDKKSAEDIAMQAEAVDPQAMHDEMAVLANTTTEEDYEKMEKESIRFSEGKLQEEKLSEKAAETFAWISAEVKMMLNDDSSKIAEMMIDGANMGIKSITEKLNRYPEAEKESISLAKKFEKTCEKLIQDMKKYL